ncbi:basic leucine zipper transcriptional factor ATF-like 2 isoform X1 [Mustela nigripes]|uniref:Basic leucine zipper transcriptional factor ATF-like 2 n=2 Tax=Mustela putorius furo TaxID=9669 RepID=M3YM23_MUSPF|nr:basic leucine zipper transcriptional factor ATF-like 2 isoform X1 [Mustela putorius furo]XP_059257914.1 basic leucine zipper transcriptional factor ATF-like 2 isoform X1 [Mustela nigripes]
MHLCGGNGLLTRTDPEDHQRLKKKQKNRAAAQRSRQKHTDKADALHQQHETLEKHNHVLRKEIQALQAELVWWSRTLRTHEDMCLVDSATCLAPGTPGGWGQTERPPDPVFHGQHGCQEPLGLFQTPVSSPSAHRLSPDLQPHSSPGLPVSPLPSLSLGSTKVTAPSAQPSPSPVQSASPLGSSLPRPSSELDTLLPSPPALCGPLQPLVMEYPTSGKLGSSADNLSVALGVACLQGSEHKPGVLSAAHQLGLGVDPSPHPLLAFPLLSSAQVHF